MMSRELLNRTAWRCGRSLEEVERVMIAFLTELAFGVDGGGMKTAYFGALAAPQPGRAEPVREQASIGGGLAGWEVPGAPRDA